jgi:hypothetical protein
LDSGRLEEQERWELGELEGLGNILDAKPRKLRGATTGHYLAEKLLRVRGRDGATTPLVANAVQREYERQRRRTNLVLKARQMGITTWIAGRFFLKTILQPGTLTLQLAQNQRAAEELFRIVHRFYGLLPEELRDGVLRASHANKRQLIFPRMDSEYRVDSAGNVSAGRGMTIQNLHCSEVAFWPRHAVEMLAGLRAAVAKTGEIVLESTPNGAQGCFYEEWTRGGDDVARHFFPWWMEPTYVGAPVRAEGQNERERELVRAHGLSAAQIGFRRMLESGFRELARQEYAEDAEQCFLSSGACVFDTDAITARLSEVGEPAEKRANGLWVWAAAKAGRKYVLAADPAGGGTAGDFAAIEVVDVATGLQCAELVAHASPREIAKAALELAAEYNGALIAVERNNHGAAVLAHFEGASANVYAHAGVPGWPTNTLTRPAIIERLGVALATQAGTISSERLLRECRAFVRHADGKVAAANGAHDDCVMAMAIALAVRAEMQYGG